MTMMTTHPLHLQSALIMAVMMTRMGDGYDDDPYLVLIRFKSAARADWRCRGCVVIVIIITVGDAEDAR